MCDDVTDIIVALCELWIHCDWDGTYNIPDWGVRNLFVTHLTKTIRLTLKLLFILKMNWAIKRISIQSEH